MLLVEVGERIEKVAEKAKVESSGNVYRIRRYLWRNDHGETTEERGPVHANVAAARHA
jgi:hypothetical protein